MPTRNKRNRRNRKRRSRRQRGGNSIVPICIYSHSEFFDILQIQIDYLTKLFKGTQQPIYLFTDKQFEGPTELRCTTVLYDDSTAYMQRLASCIKQVPAPYVILSHENDVLLQYDVSAMNALVTVMKQRGIDSIDLKHHDTQEERIQVTPTLSISKVVHPMIFRVQPRLWKKESALQLFTANPAKNYRRAENSNVQNSIKGQKTFEVSSTTPLQSWYFGVDKTSPEYLFIHITNGLKFSPTPQAKGLTVDPIVQAELDAIQKTYIDSPHATREQADANFDPYAEVYDKA